MPTHLPECEWPEVIKRHLQESVNLTLETAEVCCDEIRAAARLLVDCYRGGGKVLLCGNGGSAADCQHIAAELVSLLHKDRPRAGLAAIALTTDTSVLTARANDFGFEEIFSRQVEALGAPNDVLVAISTSGNSANVIRAVRSAKAGGLRTLGLLGEGGALVQLVDHAIVVPSRDTQHVQETLLAVEHILCDLTERSLFPR